MARRVGRSPFWQEIIGFLLAKYVRLVQITSRVTTVPEDIGKAIEGETPIICAMWHGQHLMVSFAWPDTIDRFAALISRHEDAGAQAAALEHLGVTPVRGSGGPADRARYKGGAPAMRELLRQLELGASVAMTADVPKRARVCGLGIVSLAKLSGPADRSDRRGHEPADPVRHLGPRLPRPAVQPRRGADRRSRARAAGRRRRGDGGGAPRRAAGPRRGARARLCDGRRDRSRREFENGMTAPLTLHVYRALTAIGTPLAVPFLALRLRRGKEDRERIGERRGRAGLARPLGRLVWLHGASVGEAVSLLPFVERIARAGATALVTTGTVTSAALLSRRLPAGGAAPVRPARQSVLPAPLPAPLAPGRGAGRRIRSCGRT